MTADQQPGTPKANVQEPLPDRVAPDAISLQENTDKTRPRQPAASRVATLLLPVAVALALLVGLIDPTFQTFRFLGAALLAYCALIVLQRLAGKAPILSIRIPPQLALLSAALCFAFCSGEVSLRLFFHHLFRDWHHMAPVGETIGYEYDRVLGWSPVPNQRRALLIPPETNPVVIVNNSKGLRDSEPALDARPGLLVLGDSCVWGYQINAEVRFTEKLRARHPKWQVYNFGVAGYGTDQEYLLLQRHMAEFHPQVVFLLFCSQNDVTDNCSSAVSRLAYKPYFTLAPNGLRLHAVPVPLSDRVFCMRHPILSKSHLVRLLMRAWGDLRCPLPPYNRAVTPALLKELQRYVREHEATFCVGLTRPLFEIEQCLKAASIPYVDLSTDLTYDGTHWTEAGHIFAADRIEDFLLRQRLLQP